MVLQSYGSGCGHNLVRLKNLATDKRSSLFCRRVIDEEEAKLSPVLQLPGPAQWSSNLKFGLENFQRNLFLPFQ